MVGWVPWMGQERPPRGAARLRTDGHWSVRDLRALWLLNEGSGNRVYDWTRNQCHGVMPASTWHWGDDPPYGMCFWREYSATVAGLNCGNKAAYNTYPLSAVVLARMAITSSYSHYFGRGEFTTDNRCVWLIHKYPGNRIYWMANDAAATTVFRVSATHPTVGIWHMFVGTWDGTTGTNGVKLYADGALLASGTASSTALQQSRNVYIGGYQKERNHQGPIALAAIYARPLTAEEVASLWRHPFQMLEVPAWTAWGDIVAGGETLSLTRSTVLFGQESYTSTSDIALWAADRQSQLADITLYASELQERLAAIALLASEALGNERTVLLSGADVKAVLREVALHGSDEESLTRALELYGSSAEIIARNMALYGSDPEALARAVTLYGEEGISALRGLALYGLSADAVEHALTLMGADSQTREHVLSVYGAETTSASRAVELWGGGDLQTLTRAVVLLGAEVAAHEWALSLYGRDDQTVTRALVMAGLERLTAERLVRLYGSHAPSVARAVVMWGAGPPIRLVLPDAVWWLTPDGTIYAERWKP